VAYLTVKILKDQPGRIEAFVTKIANRLPFLIEREGGEKFFTKILFTRSGRILELTPSKRSDFVRAIELLKTADNAASKNVMLANDKERYALTDLLHTAEFGGNTSRGGGKGNKGDMAEAIFAAAITARFISKNTSVTLSDVVSIIDMINNQKQKQDLTFKSPNANPKIIDKVTYSVNLAVSNLAALTDKSRQSSLTKIINSAVKYANSKNVSELARSMYFNGKYNEVQVICDGLGNQKGSKVDVRVIIDDIPTNINVSLKTGSVKQFGQIGGLGFDKLRDLWKNLLNIDVKAAETDYLDMIKKQDEFGAAEVVYRKAMTMFNTAMQSTQSRNVMYNNIAHGIKYYSTLHEKDVSMVQLTSKEAILYKFNNLEVLLHTVKLVAKMRTGQYPTLDIMDDKGNILITVRVKYERSKDYKRNYIEKGKLLTTLAGSIV
jgi:PKD repeat protein